MSKSNKFNINQPVWWINTDYEIERSDIEVIQVYGGDIRYEISGCSPILKESEVFSTLEEAKIALIELNRKKIKKSIDVIIKLTREEDSDEERGKCLRDALFSMIDIIIGIHKDGNEGSVSLKSRFTIKD